MNAAELRATLAPLLRTLDALKTLDANAETVVGQESTLRSLRKQQDDLKGETEGLKAERSRLATAVDDLVRQRDGEQQKLTALRQSHQQALAEHENWVRGLADERTAKQKELLAQHAADRKLYEQATAELTKKKEALEQDLEKTRAKVAAFHSGLGQLAQK